LKAKLLIVELDNWIVDEEELDGRIKIFPKKCFRFPLLAYGEIIP
jgi:hypothetical protein